LGRVGERFSRVEKADFFPGVDRGHDAELLTGVLK
jgi:hypothetical protein